MKNYNISKKLKFVLAIIILPLITSCEALKYKKVDARDVPTDPAKRVKKNIEEGRGFRVMGGNNKRGVFEFASSNYLWRATLDTIDFMPLASANYSGGIVVTDWYSENNSTKESIKISVRFLSNEIRADALNIKIFLRTCDQNLNCSISENQGQLQNELRSNILKKAAVYEKEGIKKSKKDNPYKNSYLDDKDGN
jgi:hypothetical protein|tara:strand:+ start:141 stop:725 length:585 start_codon:yes stop_codon:yes gene_type:complete